jgi:hypothetical protein
VKGPGLGKTRANRGNNAILPIDTFRKYSTLLSEKPSSKTVALDKTPEQIIRIAIHRLSSNNIQHGE